MINCTLPTPADLGSSDEAAYSFAQRKTLPPWGFEGRLPKFRVRDVR